jgi:hypothetical protein
MQIVCVDFHFGGSAVARQNSIGRSTLPVFDFLKVF